MTTQNGKTLHYISVSANAFGRAIGLPRDVYVPDRRMHFASVDGESFYGVPRRPEGPADDEAFENLIGARPDFIPMSVDRGFLERVSGASAEVITP